MRLENGRNYIMLIVEGSNSFWLGSSASLITEDRDVAWAERSYRKHPALKHFIASYVEADRPNRNGQLWSLADLQKNYETVKGTPVDWAHAVRKVIGVVSDAELLYTKKANSEEADIDHPFVEILGTVWPFNFPDEYQVLSNANAEGQLYVSMECVAESLTCTGDGGCSRTFPYKGPRDVSYCDCLNDRRGNRLLNNPTFLGAALLVPPISPGWKDAVVDLSKLMKDHALDVETGYESLSQDLPHLEPKTWESLMVMVMELAHGTK